MYSGFFHKEKTQRTYKGDNSQDHEEILLLHAFQSECCDKTSENLRTHVKYPEIAEKETLCVFSSTIRYVLTLAHPLNSLSEAVQNRQYNDEKTDKVDFSVKLLHLRIRFLISTESKRQDPRCVNK